MENVVVCQKDSKKAELQMDGDEKKKQRDPH